MAHQIDLFCVPQLVDVGHPEVDRNGGSSLAWIVGGALPTVIGNADPAAAASAGSPDGGVCQEDQGSSRR